MRFLNNDVLNGHESNCYVNYVHVSKGTNKLCTHEYGTKLLTGIQCNNKFF